MPTPQEREAALFALAVEKPVAERQALAMMDHPNIARILDAGMTGESDRISEAGSQISENAQSI